MSSPLITIVRSLSFSEDRTAELDTFSESAWPQVLGLCDRAHLTLPMGVRALHRLPAAPRKRVERNLVDNAARHQRAIGTYREIATAFEERGIDFVVLKGFSHQPHYSSNINHRPQYDLDFYCPPESIEPALEAILGLGYVKFRETSSPTDHRPPLIRKTGWHFADDYFDPEMPLTVELHHRLWDRETERFHSPDVQTIWSRRIKERYADLEIPALSHEDRLSYATWHLVRHLLRGDLRPHHVYEIAHFLHTTAENGEWWINWSRSQTSDSSVLIAGMAFRLALDWFECQMHSEAQHAIQQLQPRALRWFDTFALSPLAWEHPNKNELFLHLSLVTGFRDRASIVTRRLIPTHFQTPLIDAHEPHPNARLRLKRRVSALWFIVERSIHHLKALGRFAQSSLLWSKALAQPPQRLSRRKLRVENVSP